MRKDGFLWFTSFGLIALLAWASLAQLDIVVRGSGQAIPEIKSQILQNLEGGIIAEILVAEGEIVSAGQTVIKLDSTAYQHAVTEMESKLISLYTKFDRLTAEQNGDDAPTFRFEFNAAATESIELELDLFETRRNDLAVRNEADLRIASLRAQEVEMLRPLTADNTVSQIDLLRVEILEAEAASKAQIAIAEFRRNVAEERASTLQEILQIEEAIQVKQDQLERTQIKSPVDGFVNAISFATIGAVVSPGEDILEITPIGSSLMVEARISPTDVAFVRVGMSANIKFTAYDYTIFGSFLGEVVNVSSDTLKEQTSSGEVPYYAVKIRLLDRTRSDNRVVEILPGMVADVELITGQRTVLQYLLKPLFKASLAFSER